jgi:hypothetical protein
MSNQEESKLIKLANIVVEWNKELKEEMYLVLDEFSNEVRAIEKLFKENDIPDFSYDWVDETDPEEGTLRLMWDNPRIVFVYDCEPTPLLGESAQIRTVCRLQFEKFLESYIKSNLMLRD